MLSFFFTHSAFVRELTVNDNNVNDTNLSCYICISIYFICVRFFPRTIVINGRFFYIHFWKLKLLLFHISLYHFSFRPNYYHYYFIHCYHFILVYFSRSLFFRLAIIPFGVAIVVLSYLELMIICSFFFFFLFICLFEMPFTKCECTTRKKRKKTNKK